MMANLTIDQYREKGYAPRVRLVKCECSLCPGHEVLDPIDVVTCPICANKMTITGGWCEWADTKCEACGYESGFID